MTSRARGCVTFLALSLVGCAKSHVAPEPLEPVCGHALDEIQVILVENGAAGCGRDEATGGGVHVGIGQAVDPFGGCVAYVDRSWSEDCASLDIDSGCAAYSGFDEVSAHLDFDESGLVSSGAIEITTFEDGEVLCTVVWELGSAIKVYP